MIEKDPIQEKFSKVFENHSLPVRPELWAGVQAKMAAAAVASSTGAVAAKGISTLSKWIIGGLITSSAVVTTVVVTQQNDEVVPQKNKVAVAQQKTDNQGASSANDVVNTTQLNDVPTQTIQPEAQVSEPKTKRTESVNNTASEPVSVNHGEHKNIEHKPANDQVNVSVKEQKTKSETEQVVKPSAGDTKKSEPKKDVVSPTKSKSTSGENSDKKDPIVPTQSDVKAVKCELTIPNQFSPNNDNFGDEFKLLAHENLSENDFSVSVLDKQGKVVFKSDDINFGWNGRDLNGDPLEEGTYVYLIVGKDTAGKSIKRHGYLMLQLK